MTTKVIKAIIEKASDGGYGIYCPDLEDISLYGYGLTETEAKENLQENLEMFIDESENENIINVLNNGNISFDYQYDISGFFKTYNFFNISELAKRIGINPSLMRRYKQGITLASKDQKKENRTRNSYFSQRIMCSSVLNNSKLFV